MKNTVTRSILQQAQAIKSGIAGLGRTILSALFNNPRIECEDEIHRRKSMSLEVANICICLSSIINTAILLLFLFWKI